MYIHISPNWRFSSSLYFFSLSHFFALFVCVFTDVRMFQALRINPKLAVRRRSSKAKGVQRPNVNRTNVHTRMCANDLVNKQPFHRSNSQRSSCAQASFEGNCVSYGRTYSYVCIRGRGFLYVGDHSRSSKQTPWLTNNQFVVHVPRHVYSYE